MSQEQLAPIIAMLRARTPSLPLNLDETRAIFEEFTGALPKEPDVTRTDVSVGALEGAWLEAPGAEDRTVLYLHGGGYALGSINHYEALMGRIAKAAAARVVAVNYRLAPEHPHPAAVDDAVAAYRWLLDQGQDPARLIVAGDSAGGGLTLATLVKLRDKGVVLPAGAVCISPWVDMECTGLSMETKAAEDPMLQPEALRTLGELYASGVGLTEPLASPLYAALEGLPPLLIQVGTAEILLDDSRRIVERLQSAGVDVTYREWEGMIHVWHFFAPLVDESSEAIEDLGAFARKQTP